MRRLREKLERLTGLVRNNRRAVFFVLCGCISASVEVGLFFVFSGIFALTYFPAFLSFLGGLVS